MKKFTTSVILSIFCLGIFGQNISFAAESELTTFGKDAIIYQNELKKTTKGKEYMTVIDSVIKQYENNESSLTSLKNNLAKLNTTTLSDSILANTLDYFEAKTNIALLLLQEEKNNIYTSTISDSDKTYIDGKIVSFQQNLGTKLENYFTELSNEIKTTNNRKESGNMKVNMSIDEKSFGIMKTNVEINNYTATTNNFDSQISGNLKVLFEMAVAGEENIQFELESFIDMISKEGALYFMFKDMKLDEDSKGIDDFQQYIDKFKDFAAKNQYIKYEDVQVQGIFDLMKVFDYNSAKNDVKTSLNQALLEAYKIEDEKYYLRPTKYACDSYKKLLSKFDPLNGNSCSNSQYQDMLKAFSDIGRFYISINENSKVNTIGFEGNTDSYIDENNGYISFTSDSIVEYYYSVKPNQTHSPGEFFNISYKNKTLTGGLVVASSTYDQNGEYLDSKITLDISGKANDKEEMETLKITYKAVDENNIQYVTGEFNMNSDDFNFTHKNNSYTNIANLDFSGSMDENGILNDLILNADISSRGGRYNYDTWEYTYNDKINTVFTTKINIDDKNVTGAMNFFSDGKTDPDVKILTSGTYSNKTVSLDNKVELSSDLSNDLLGYDGSTNHKIIGNFNFSADTSNNNNNMNILFDIYDNQNKIFMYEIDNKSTIESGTINSIPTPNNSIDIEEAFDITIPSYYY